MQADMFGASDPSHGQESLRPPLTVRRELDMLLVVYMVIIVSAILYPSAVFKWDFFRLMLTNLSHEGMVAMGMMLLMVAGVFDLSVGSLFSMTGVLCGWLIMRCAWPIPLAVLASLAVAFGCGMANGWLVAKAKVNALIATLGALGVFRGIAILLGGPGIANLPKDFYRWGQTEVAGLPYPAWFLFALALLFHYLLSNTRWFRQYYYIGSNAKAAKLSGIHVEKLQMLAFAISGLIAGAAGLAYSARVATAVSDAGKGLELKAISAVIIGGASLNGGKGTMLGALVGVIFMALVDNIIIIAHVPSYWQEIALGVILILAVSLDAIQTRKSSA